MILRLELNRHNRRKASPVIGLFALHSNLIDVVG